MWIHKARPYTFCDGHMRNPVGNNYVHIHVSCAQGQVHHNYYCNHLYISSPPCFFGRVPYHPYAYCFGLSSSWTTRQDVGGGGGTETSGTTEDKGAGSAAAEQPEGSEDDMSELMSNRDFLRSVLSSLPGVNPEEALQNLEEMTEQQEEEEVRELKGNMVGSAQPDIKGVCMN